jgi:hypothetical protein
VIVNVSPMLEVKPFSSVTCNDTLLRSTGTGKPCINQYAVGAGRRRSFGSAVSAQRDDFHAGQTAQSAGMPPPRKGPASPGASVRQQRPADQSVFLLYRARDFRVYFASSYSPSPLQLHPSPDGEQCQVPFPFTPLSFPVPSPKLHVPWAPVGLPSFNVVVPW